MLVETFQVRARDTWQWHQDIVHKEDLSSLVFICLFIIYLLTVETEHRAPEYTKHVLYHLGHQPGELSHALLGFHANSWKRTLRGHLHAH